MDKDVKLMGEQLESEIKMLRLEIKKLTKAPEPGDFQLIRSEIKKIMGIKDALTQKWEFSNFFKSCSPMGQIWGCLEILMSCSRGNSILVNAIEQVLLKENLIMVDDLRKAESEFLSCWYEIPDELLNLF